MARLTVTVPDDVERVIEKISREQGTSKVEVVRRAFALLKLADEEKAKGKSLGIVRETADNKLEVDTKILGL